MKQATRLRAYKASIYLYATSACIVAALSQPARSEAVTSEAVPGWKLVWAEEFNYTGPPDPKMWGYEEGFVRNKEKQIYTRDRLKNARVENGNLVIEAHKEIFQNPNYKPGSNAPQSANYTSASLITRNKASWQYGRIETRAKLPAGKGLWPAVWTKGIWGSWPACGEIDILEWTSKTPGFIFASLHYGSESNPLKSTKNFDVPAINADFHVYAMEWTADRIEFYFDGRKYHEFNVNDAGLGSDNPFRKPHFLLVNLALGGYTGGRIDDAAMPQKFLVDYIRVYQRQKPAHPKPAPDPG